MSRDHNDVLPMTVIRALSESSFLFLGYTLDDWAFRVILQGLVKALKTPAKLNVGVQLEATPGLDTEKAIDYLRRYLGQFNIDIYWGTPRQFMTELRAEWQRYKRESEGDDDW